MNFKRWPYWLKGGVTASIIPAVLILIPLNFKIFTGLNIFLLPGLPAALILFANPTFFGCYYIIFAGSYNNPNYCGSLLEVSVFVTAFIFYFVIGAFIGWFYGKIKGISKKKDRI